jgi:hypothetical protein
LPSLDLLIAWIEIHCREENAEPRIFVPEERVPIARFEEVQV